jgi:hypothetical protein
MGVNLHQTNLCMMHKKTYLNKGLINKKHNEIIVGFANR